MTVTDTDISDEIRRQITSARSVAPRDVATSLAADSPWQKLLPRVRAEAVKLEMAGELVFVRKRKIVTSDSLKGVYRLASPAQWQTDHQNSEMVEGGTDD